MELPKDDMILLSLINTKLRDYYKNLDELCEDLNVNKADLEQRLKAVDYVYNEELNRFM